MRIQLPPNAASAAFLHAAAVEFDSLGRENRGGSRRITPEESFRRRKDSACGEMAAAIAEGLPWRAGFRAFGKPDVGDDIDVGTRPDKTDRKGVPYGLRVGAGKLRNPGMFHMLVISVKESEVYDVIGGLRGHEILRLVQDHPEWKQNPYGKDPVYWIPREYLRPYHNA